MNRSDREFARVLRQAAPVPLWAKTIGVVIGASVIVLVLSLLGLAAVATWAGIAALIATIH